MLTINSQLKKSVLTLSVNGVLDFSTIHIFNDNIGSLDGTSSIIIDFSKMEFIDSTGIGAILELIYRGNESNICFQLEGLNPETKELFDTVGVFQVLDALGKGGV